ncbi:ERMES complex subunit [Entomophthora muscae]|uniref:ERMES complex subunit n=1 Tax=Entomophthora muscae TaxID=34485 RepID=A0ACC2UUX6_9FUNG|nr:ERMES complex subunit [Entomophthora muscae]
MLKLTYQGDAYLVLRTHVQVNPVKIKSEISIQARRGMLAAHQPLIVPMLLRISHLKLRGIISLAVSPHSGITLVFKNDPLQGVEVSSTFDDLDSVKTFIQDQIEDSLRTMFQEDLPRIIHSFSDKLRPKKQPPQPLSTKRVPSYSSTSPSPTLCSEGLPRCHSPEPYAQAKDSTSLPDIPTLINPSVKCGMSQIGLGALQPLSMPGLPRRNYSFNHLAGLNKKCLQSLHDGDCSSGYQSPPSSRRHQRTHPNHPPPVFHRVGPIPLTHTTLAPEQGLRGLLGTFPKPPSHPIQRPFSLDFRHP